MKKGEPPQFSNRVVAQTTQRKDVSFMYSIRQGQLFSLQDIFEFSPTDRYTMIFGTINIQPIIHMLSKKTIYGAPKTLNYHAMIYSLMARILEGIPTIKLLVRRLKQDPFFRLDCGFTFSDRIPSQASFSRLIRKIQGSFVLDEIDNELLKQAIQEGFIDDDHVSVDASHAEARDRAVAQEEEAEPSDPQKQPKKRRGRMKKEAYEAWKKEQQEIENNLPVFEKKIEAQLAYSFDELRSEMPLAPKWGIKKNSEGKNVFWFGYKAHLAVGTKSQYILQHLLSSGNLNDGKAAIPLLKGIQERLPMLPIKKVMADAGYDLLPIYQQINSMQADAVIAYNKRNESPIEGFTKHFAPTCVREHAYRYDSYDPKYQTLKYTKPKECKDCPLANDTLCQKAYKIKRSLDQRKYQAPARGTKAWKKLYKERTSVERVFAYLKEFFQLNNIRYRSGSLAKVQFDLTCLLYNAAKLAIDRLNRNQFFKAA